MILRSLLTSAILISNACFAHDISIAMPIQKNSEDKTYIKGPSENITALFMISSPEDCVGQGNSNVYLKKKDGTFYISPHRDNEVSIRFRGDFDGFYSDVDEWNVTFVAARDQCLKPGIYRYSPYNDNHPKFFFSGRRPVYDNTSADFEILEIIYDKGEVVSLAANFIQKCGSSTPPLLGSIRYNSSFPIEARFNEFFNISYVSTNSSFNATVKRPELSDSLSISISSDERDFEVWPLPYQCDGVEILITDDEKGSWVFDFAAPLNESFKVGKYEHASQYPFHSSSLAGIRIIAPEGGITRPTGSFEVLRLVRDENGQISSLDIDFTVENEKGETLKGSIRFNSFE